MNRHTINSTGALLALALYTCAQHALAQTTQDQAFAEGKAYKPANAGIRDGITPNALAQVPGQDTATTGELTSLYGANLTAPGKGKVAACAAYVPGSDGYKNAECDTVNYVVRNPGQRPAYTIDKQNDPLIVGGNAVRNAPHAHTAGMSGLSGNYTACTEKTTSTPARIETERCDIDRLVTEAQCSTTLSVTYSWQPYTSQAGADLRYGRCAPDHVRGDRLALPLTGNADSCFMPDGRFIAKVSVPVFQDRWDDSACTALSNGPAITE